MFFYEELHNTYTFLCGHMCTCVHVEGRGQPQELFPGGVHVSFLSGLRWALLLGSLIRLGWLDTEPCGSTFPELGLQCINTPSFL